MVQVRGWGWKELTSGLAVAGVLNLDWLLHQPRSSLWTHYRDSRYYTLGL